MNTVKRIYQDLKGDKIIWMIFIILGMYSMMSVYSATGSMAFKVRGGNTEYYLIQQFVFVSIGAFLAFMCYKWNYINYSRLAPFLMVISIPLLIYTIGFGTEINSARRWITIPWIDKTIQTSDFAKLALIIYVARSLATKQEYIKDFQSAFLPIILPVIVVCGLIAPADLSTAGLLFITCLLMMFIGRVSLKYVGLLLLMGMVLASILILLGAAFPEFVRLETWVNRIHEFWYNPGDTYQVNQSKIAIAEGGLTGVGPGHSLQKNYLPSPYADFIYAVICEEYGLLFGGFPILALYLWLLFRCMTIVTRSPKAFGAILAMGLCLNIVIQAFANIAVSVQLVPVTGLTLPLVSMGGTSILFTCIAFGIILSVSKFVDEARQQKLELIEIEEDHASHH